MEAPENGGALCRRTGRTPQARACIQDVGLVQVKAVLLITVCDNERRLDQEKMKVELESLFGDVPKYAMHAWILDKEENNSNTYTFIKACVNLVVSFGYHVENKSIHGHHTF